MACGQPVSVGGLLHPARLVLESLARPVGLDIDRSRRRRSQQCRRDIPRSDSRGGSARTGRRCAAASGRRATADRPAARCDGGRRQSESCSLPCARARARDRRWPASSRRRRCRRRSARRPISASVCGLKFGPRASGVSQLTRQARRDSFATASASASGSPRSSPSETMRTPRRAHSRRSAARRERPASASPMRVPPSKSLTICAAAASACSRRLIRIGARHARRAACRR